ncbi:hypothetical protein SAMN06295974_1437 [Plantibacter flavus]|uniref:Uncharacterized protein n=1 Tax=Plantibacter flavus TaxID=150123 RepID=A0A3N2C786_9MICO|nr:hypothetical protein [Plantibacter flavus]ROR83369.1 hypothetical protein EDD42_3480 [Plantibacter flavus]SMG22928.1 hypothetical protein SAMN06295974_1437 [Plantibacter flavus]
MSRIFVVFGSVYAAIAVVTAVLIAAATWFLVKVDAYPGDSALCQNAPAGALVAENPAPALELSWFPFGYQCVYPMVGGGTVATPPTDWSATQGMAVAIAFLVTGLVAAIVAGSIQRRGVRPVGTSPCPYG